MSARVLVTAAGGIVGQGIIKSLKLSNMNGGKVQYNLVAADMSPLAAGLYRCDAGILLPPASSTNYVDAIIGRCKELKIQAVFCGSDDELLTLAQSKNKIEEESGAKVVTGSIDALTIARDKWKTFEFCKTNNFACPPSAQVEDRMPFAREWGYPLVVKPKEGYGSLHIYIVKNEKEMEQAVSAIIDAGWHPFVQKYLAGDKEFTSGVTVDRNCRHTISSISIRKILKHGQTYRAFIDDFYDVRKSAEEVALKLGASGPVNVQTRLEEGRDKPVVFEINARFSATCPMRAAAGVNEPDIVFRNTMFGEDTKIDTYEKLVCLRYWNEVYVPATSYEKMLKEQTTSFKEGRSFLPNYF